ncbi:hypothetical protein BHF71_08795 [Vulcanibacillus modesticaldus]|uniref:DNA/RNA helicase n=1 Tax=Vulcanibacillus modesticaldus TaxID=337097 RepID=A0A1D2YV39_9BACI|nr:DEAD/DEAH box helicase family protein [Vulcanibacillus modesticaldus]OEF99506.1 hypothetical protein BHF71_08795 [Vulcanibacillus modesticaldus]
MKFQIYLIDNNGRLEWKITSNIEVDLAYWYEHGVSTLIATNSFFSIGYANYLLKCLEQITNTAKASISNNFYQDIDWLLENCSVGDKKCSVLKLSTKSENEQIMAIDQSWNHFAPNLQGRLLLLSEVIQLYTEVNSVNKLSRNELFKILQLGYLRNEIKITPSVTYPLISHVLYNQNELICQRCGSRKAVKIQECAVCGDNCATCEECIIYGRSKTCTPLYDFSSLARQKASDVKFLSFDSIPIRMPQLTPFQSKVANFALQYVKDRKKKDLLIWAVTGAGKTEMLFPVINHALISGSRVLFTAPRRDVIKELAPRFKNTFSDVPIVTLYGGSEEKWNDGLLFLSTIHQMIRFVGYFDLVIIDEMDAFPYHNNPRLHLLVKRALKDNGQMIYLTATPPNNWQRRIKSNEIESIILPIRYHQYPLPIPHLKLIPKKAKLLKRKTPNKVIGQFISLVEEMNGQGFIFVSGVNEVVNWTNKLKQWFPDEKIEGIYAKDHLRDYKIEMFKRGMIRFLVTTTIMERGVTVPNVHVLVIGAEGKIFEEATLIQIAGRVGRSTKYPHGYVWFLAEYLTSEMVSAKKQIKRMNKLAKKY